MKSTIQKSRGFTLVELISYMALLGVLLASIYTVYYHFSRTLTAADGTMIKERGLFHAVRTMQDDIRRSAKVLESFGPVKSSDEALILLVEGEKDADDRVIVYRLADSKKTLLRIEAPAHGQPKEIMSVSLGYDIEGFAFTRAEDGPRLLKVRLSMKEGPLGILRKRPLTFYTAMRNG